MRLHEITSFLIQPYQESPHNHPSLFALPGVPAQPPFSFHPTRSPYKITLLIATLLGVPARLRFSFHLTRSPLTIALLFGSCQKKLPLHVKVPPSTQSLFPFHLATSHECSTFSFLLTTCPRSLTLISPRFKESPRHTRPFFSTLPRVPTRPPLSFHLSRNLPNLFNLSRRPLSYLFHFTRIPCVLPLHFSP